MNSAKVTTKKSTKSFGPTSTKNPAELSTPAASSSKNPPLNAPIDGNRALALKPATPVSRPTHTPTKIPTNAVRVTEVKAPAPQSFGSLAGTPTAPPSKAVAVQEKQKSAAPTTAAQRTTTIEVKIDVGFGNTVFLRGQGPGLSWERGVPCECVDRNTWRWTAPRAEKLTFKLLLNDSVWAKGADVVIGAGEKLQVVPAF